MADRGANRGMRDEAGVGPNPTDARRLVPMRDLKSYKVADGEPDIRGWKVFTATGRELGDIEDLLIDTEMGEVVMVDVDLKRDDRHTLAPIKAAWIDREHHRVVLNTTMFDVDDGIPALRRSGQPVVDDYARFNERYERAYGPDGFDRDRDITIRGTSDDLRISRSTPPPAIIPDRPVESDVRRAADAFDREMDDSSSADLQPERRRYVRYGPSRPTAVEDVATERADLTPAETERIRQQSGDITTDARDTLVNPPPTEERR
jgi:sporulation protein YlmC with PRC-barrel domain